MSPSFDTLPGFGRRIACMAYESLLLLGILSVGFMLPQVLLGIGFNLLLPGWALLGNVFIVTGCYFLWYWHHGGQTLAMQTWNIKVSTPCGAPPSLPRLAMRYLLCWPSLLYFGVGIVWAFFDRDRQFLHDRLAGTRLVFNKPR